MSEKEGGWRADDPKKQTADAPLTGAGNHAAEWPSIWHGVFFGSDGLRAVWGVALFLAIAFLIFNLAAAIVLTSAILRHAQATERKPATLMTLLINDGLPLLGVAAATWIMSRTERRPVEAYGFGGQRKAALFFGGLGWGALSLAVLVAMLWRAGLLVFDGLRLHGADVWKYALVWGFGFLLVAVLEESAMRGYLQFTLARGLGRMYTKLFGARHGETLGFWTAAALLSFLFGFGHRSNPGESAVGLWSAGLIGAIFCLTLWKTGSLWWALGFHASWDWAQSFVFGVADSGTMVQGHLLATHPVGKVLLSGGATGPEGSLFVLPLLGMVTLVVWRTLPRREWVGEA